MRISRKNPGCSLSAVESALTQLSVQKPCIPPIKDTMNRIGLGKLTYLGIALKQLITARKVSCTLTIENAVNGKQTAFQLPRFLFVTCMSHRYEGGGFMFCPPAMDNDGILDLCCVGNISKVLVLLALPTAFFGKHYFVKGSMLTQPHRCLSLPPLPYGYIRTAK